MKDTISVKKLEWGKTSYGTPEVFTDVGVYRIVSAWNGGWSLTRNNSTIPDSDGRSNFSTQEAAKSAAQADYEARILSAIEVSASDIGNPIAGLKDKLIKDADWLSEYGHQLHEECEYHDGGHTANRLQAIGERITKLLEKTELPEDKTVKRRIADALEYVWSGLDCDVDHIDSIISHMNGNGLRIVEVGIPATEPSPRAQALEEAARCVDAKAEEYEEEARDVRNSTDDKRLCKAISVRLRGSAAAIRALSSQTVADGPEQSVSRALRSVEVLPASPGASETRPTGGSDHV